MIPGKTYRIKLDLVTCHSIDIDEGKDFKPGRVLRQGETVVCVEAKDGFARLLTHDSLLLWTFNDDRAAE